MSESKPEIIACTFDLSEPREITVPTPQLVSCTFEDPKKDKKDEEKCPRSDTIPACPKCGKSDNVVKIVFGKPSPELMQHAKDGLVALGGCCPPMTGEKPRDYKCKICNDDF